MSAAHISFFSFFKASILTFGCVTGSIMGGIQSGKLGRRFSMLIDCLAFGTGLLLLALSPNFYVALCSRFILGHGGASAIVSIPIYVGELSQPQIRNLTSSLTVISFSSGVSAMLLLGALFPWRIAIGVSAVVPFMTFFLLLCCPESPVWLVTKGKDEQAKQVLERLRGKDNLDIREAEFNRIQMNIKIEAKEEELVAGKGTILSHFISWYLW